MADKSKKYFMCSKGRTARFWLALLFIGLMAAAVLFGPTALKRFLSVEKDWEEESQSISAQAKKAMTDVFVKIIRSSLSENSGENKICLPASDYLLLTAMAERVSGESREEILNILGMDNMEDAEQNAKYLWAAVQGSDEECELFTLKWQGSLISSIDVKAKWSSFSRLNSQKGWFYTAESTEHPTFMKRQIVSRWHWIGNDFRASMVLMKNEMSLWFILPEKGLSPEETVVKEEFAAFLQEQIFRTRTNQEAILADYSIPRFSFAAENDPRSSFERMGIVKCFTLENDDIEESAQNRGISLGRQIVNIKVNEEGINRNAFPRLSPDHNDPHSEQVVEFMLNRPFLFILMGRDGIPVFAGVVNDP
ncbi:MAG: hypothetical protein IJK77_02185 [Lachnospiraceae bacterium]|nr:hypothetical protein [Lachnospiraceae bacterium]MBQ9910433.1 hypothetical protein [Lachnospiraceae bacterium]